mmetsp:Transcript_91402/g.232555  ORF Transcript_91402/g.232555 Transcript_91402/m.232555 type:complete len:279 (-) Transcript_91402:86-922(-)
MHLLPAVEAAPLAHGANPARAHVVHIVEEHLIPTVPATQQKGHGGVQRGPSAFGVGCQELVPPMRVVEIRDEDPSRREANAAEHRDYRNELPTLAERPAHAPRAQHPDGAPQAQQERDVLHTKREPLRVERLIALAGRTGVRESAPPQKRKETAGVAGSGKVPEWHQGHREPTVPLRSPLLQDVEPTCGVPAELAVVQEVERRVVVPVVFHDDVHPRQRDEVREGVRDVTLPLVRREGGAVDDVVQDVHILDAERNHDGSEDRGRGADADADHGSVLE